MDKNEHMNFRSVSEEEDSPLEQTTLGFESFCQGDKVSAESQVGSVSPIASCATVQPSW